MKAFWMTTVWLWVLLGPASTMAECRYGSVPDSASLFDFVQQTVSTEGGPSDLIVNLSFEPVQARITLRASDREYVIRWVTEGRCSPPFAFIDHLPP